MAATLIDPVKLATALRGYADAIARHGVDSAEAQAIRAAHQDDAEFIEYADAFERLRANLRSSVVVEGSGAMVGAKAAEPAVAG
jgi:hypothetical protein